MTTERTRTELSDAQVWELERLRNRLQNEELGHRDFPAIQALDAALASRQGAAPTPVDGHDAACESELTTHGYTPCQCVERRLTERLTAAPPLENCVCHDDDTAYGLIRCPVHAAPTPPSPWTRAQTEAAAEYLEAFTAPMEWTMETQHRYAAMLRAYSALLPPTPETPLTDKGE